MRKKASLQTILWLILLVCLSACAGKKQQKIALPADFKGPKELGRLYGVRITPEDNIFLYNEGARWLGVPHKLGGSTKRGVDCSGFVAIVYREIYGKRLARNSADMLRHDCKKIRRRIHCGNRSGFDLVCHRRHKGIYKLHRFAGVYNML